MAAELQDDLAISEMRCSKTGSKILIRQKKKIKIIHFTADVG